MTSDKASVSVSFNVEIVSTAWIVFNNEGCPEAVGTDEENAINRFLHFHHNFLSLWEAYWIPRGYTCKQCDIVSPSSDPSLKVESVSYV